MKLGTLAPLLLVLVCLPSAVAQFGSCPAPETARIPIKESFQVTIEKQINLPGYTFLFDVPAQQYAVIENISIKGTHAANTYLAIELATSLGLGQRTFPAKFTVVQGGQARRVVPTQNYARHFLYTQQSAGAIPIGVRESTRIVAGPNTPVSIGIQSATPIEPLSITITGTFFNRCTPLP